MLNNALSTKSKEVAIILTVEIVGFLAHMEYNDGKRGFTGWGNKEETDLYAILNDLNQNGVMFALSNVIEHKGKRNEILEKWCRDNGYNLHDISMKYDNCIHCPKNTGTTKEVLITNY